MVNFSSGAVHVNERVLEPRSGSSDRKKQTQRKQSGIEGQTGTIELGPRALLCVTMRSSLAKA